MASTPSNHADGLLRARRAAVMAIVAGAFHLVAACVVRCNKAPA